jgi:hypothetical protein
MIRAESLIGGAARRRYADDGSPDYSAPEMILLRLRWFDWVTADTIREALELDGQPERERNRFSSALSKLLKTGRVERRPCAGPWFWEYRLSPVQPVAKPYVEHDTDEDGNRIKAVRPAIPASVRKRRLRARMLAEGLCFRCRGVLDNKHASCDACLDAMRADRRARERRRTEPVRRAA